MTIAILFQQRKIDFTENINLLDIDVIVYGKVRCFTQPNFYSQDMRKKITLRKRLLDRN